LAMLSSYQKQGGAALGTVVGQSDGLFVGDRSVVRNQATNLGVLIAKAQMVKTKADVGVMNSGGIRADLEGGEITYKEVLTVQPFANILTYVDFSGRELTEYLTASVNMAAGSGAFAQISGAEIKVANGKVTSMSVAGMAIDMNKTYRLAVNSYMASGGDGYPKISDHVNFVDTGFVDADMLVEYIQNNSPLSVSDFEPGAAIERM